MYSGGGTKNGCGQKNISRGVLFPEILVRRGKFSELIEAALSLVTSNLNMFDFLSLPREIRDIIYELTLVSQQPISALSFAYQNDCLLPAQKHDLCPQMLQTCRQINVEAHHVLYGKNLFFIDVSMHLHEALRTREVQKAFKKRSFSVESELFEPEIVDVMRRPVYAHPRIHDIKRFQIQLRQIVPSRPHWDDLNVRVSNILHDICVNFINPGYLELLIISSDGCLAAELWLPAAANNSGLASQMETLMWMYHEWHLERAMLAAYKNHIFVWLNSTYAKDRYSLDGESVFYRDIRTLRSQKYQRAVVSRSLPRRYKIIS